jgi:1-phosphofructokinase
LKRRTKLDDGRGPKIATVTLNPAIDKTMSAPGFALGRTNRATIEQTDPGGKGVNVAKALRQFNCPVAALGLLAGGNGRIIRDALARLNILVDFVDVPGETRVNLKIKDPDNGSETEINEPGFPVAPEHLGALEQKIERMARPSMVIVFSGSLPPGVPSDVYARFIHIARQRGAKTILDTAGEALRCGIQAGPDLVKPNVAEAEELLGAPIRGEGELVAAAWRLIGLGARAAVISCGPEGAVASDGGACFRARPPVIHPSSSIGSGDAMVAALAWSMIRELPFEEAVRLAAAAGTATAAMNGSGIGELVEIRDLALRVRLERIAEPVEAHK